MLCDPGALGLEPQGELIARMEESGYIQRLNPRNVAHRARPEDTKPRRGDRFDRYNLSFARPAVIDAARMSAVGAPSIGRTRLAQDVLADLVA